MSCSTRFRTFALLAAAAAVIALAATALFRPPHQAEAAGQAPEASKAEAAAAQAAQPDGAQAIRKASAAYVEALNRGDLDALLAFWAPDSDYIDEAGKHTHGRDAIAALFKKALPQLKGAKASGKVNSLKLLRPEVALEDGSLEFAYPDGTKESNRYAVVWIKAGDRWLISSARDLPAEVADVPSLAYLQLKALEWLVGEWQDETGKEGVQLTCRWATNKSFLLMEYTVKLEGAEPLHVTKRVGWDARHGLIRSWMFDSAGGFGEGYWRREGKDWVAGISGILPDGGAGGATGVWRFLDANTFVWRSADREVDGQPMADVEVKFVRKGASK